MLALCWIDLALGVLFTFLEVRRPDNAEDLQSTVIFAIVETALFAVLYLKLGQGRHWARIVFTIATLGAVALTLVFYSPGGQDYNLFDPNILSRLVLWISSLVLLCTSATRSWFASMRAEHSLR